MKTHPAIAKILARDDLEPAYRWVVEDVDRMDKVSRAHQGHSGTGRGDYISAAHADLIKAGVEHINGMAADIWLCRFLRGLPQ